MVCVRGSNYILCLDGRRRTKLQLASELSRLATTPLRFAITSPPSGCEGDFHPQAVKHARHTNKRAPGNRSPLLTEGL